VAGEDAAEVATGRSIVSVVLDFAPGAQVPEHVHGGPLIVQVLSGQLTLTEDAGAKTYNAGGMFTENTGHVHNAFNEGGTPTQVLVSALIPKGAELQTIVDQSGAPPSGMPRTGSGNSDWPLWTVLLASVALFAGVSLRKRSATGRP
jgi:quercetin dioxygenase-like cupin family protein